MFHGSAVATVRVHHDDGEPAARRVGQGTQPCTAGPWLDVAVNVRARRGRTRRWRTRAPSARFPRARTRRPASRPPPSRSGAPPTTVCGVMGYALITCGRASRTPFGEGPRRRKGTASSGIRPLRLLACVRCKRDSRSRGRAFDSSRRISCALRGKRLSLGVPWRSPRNGIPSHTRRILCRNRSPPPQAPAVAVSVSHRPPRLHLRLCSLQRHRRSPHQPCRSFHPGSAYSTPNNRCTQRDPPRGGRCATRRSSQRGSLLHSMSSAHTSQGCSSSQRSVGMAQPSRSRRLRSTRESDEAVDGSINGFRSCTFRALRIGRSCMAARHPPRSTRCRTRRRS